MYYPILSLVMKPLNETPHGLIDAQTKRSSFTYPPLDVSHLLRTLGFIWEFPTAFNAMAAELMRQPAEQIVLDEVPRRSVDHLGSHCLNKG
jgi:hypothetical protein